MPPARSYWLVKSEPDCFSIHDLAKLPKQTTCWSGVRNYQARNTMRDQMKRGDGVLFYHSSCDPPAVAGTAVVTREGYADTTALDARDDHYDPKSTKDNPIWAMVDIRLETIFPEPVPIGVLRSLPALKEMELLRAGSRLSVQPVREKEFQAIVALAGKAPAAAAKTTKQKKAPTSKKPTKKRAR